MARLQRVTAALASTLDRERMASLIVDQCLEALGAAAGSVAGMDPDGTELRILAARGYPRSQVAAFARFALDAPVPMAEAARTGEAVFVSAVEDAPPARFPHMLHDDPGRVGWAAVPLRVGPRTIGALGLSFAGTNLPVAEDGAFLLALAQQCAQALERARLHDAEQEALERAHAAEHAKDESLALLDTILESAPVGLAFWDRQARFVRVNRALAEIDGAAPDAHLGRTIEQALPGFPGIVQATVAQVMESGEPVVEREVSGVAPGRPGEQRHWLASYYPVRATGDTVLGVGAVIQEITDRKRAERERERLYRERLEDRARLERLGRSQRALNAELQAIIRAMNDAVLVFDPGGRAIFANVAAQSILPADHIATFDDVVGHLDDRAGVAPRLGSPSSQGPVELALRAGGDRWVEVSAYPVVIAPEGAIRSDGVETILFLRDITEVRRARVARDAFIGVLSHELRTPVTTIFGNTSLINRPDREMDPESRREAYADIQSEAERLFRLVEDLLVLARYGEDARHGIDTEPLLLQRIVPAMIRSEQARWPDTAFEPSIPTDLPAVQGEQTYVEQVVRNLLSNAAKYGGHDHARVRVVLDAAEDAVSVRVLDDGPGFSEEEGEHLFELFYRAPRALTAASGAGIGLFVCRSLVEAMGGRIWARPRRSGGAEFGFALRPFVEEGV